MTMKLNKFIGLGTGLLVLVVLLVVATLRPSAPLNFKPDEPGASAKPSNEATPPLLEAKAATTDYPAAGFSWLRTGGAFLLVLGLLCGGAWLARRYSPFLRGSRTTDNLQVEDRLTLGDKSRVLVLNWEGRRYLVGVCPQGFQILDRQGHGTVASGEIETLTAAILPQAAEQKSFLDVLSHQFAVDGGAFSGFFKGGSK